MGQKGCGQLCWPPWSIIMHGFWTKFYSRLWSLLSFGIEVTQSVIVSSSSVSINVASSSVWWTWWQMIMSMLTWFITEKVQVDECAKQKQAHLDLSGGAWGKVGGRVWMHAHCSTVSNREGASPLWSSTLLGTEERIAFLHFVMIMHQFARFDSMWSMTVVS